VGFCISLLEAIDERERRVLSVTEREREDGRRSVFPFPVAENTITFPHHSVNKKKKSVEKLISRACLDREKHAFLRVYIWS
jgi:hypothetical protein